uniref:Uncharacterized protein n=1 Tax=Strongyloides papillosus TaxID=174720 RepID=A0A0N5CDU9_STREA
MNLNRGDLIFDGFILESLKKDFSLLFCILLSTQKCLPVQEVYDSQMMRKLMDFLYNSESILTEIAEKEEKEDSPNIE